MLLPWKQFLSVSRRGSDYIFFVSSLESSFTMWSDIETFLLSVAAETKKFLTIKNLESCNGFYIYVDIRV